MRQIPREMRLSMVAACCAMALTGCGGGSGGANEGQMQGVNVTYPAAGTMVLGQKLNLQAASDSGLPVALESRTPSVCSVAGTELSLLTAGQCQVIASQGGGTDAKGVVWAAALPSSLLFNVAKKAQQVNFFPPEYVSSTVATEVPLSATASSGLPVTFVVVPPADGSAPVCEIVGGTLKLKGKGSCGVTAAQAGTDEFKTATAQRFIAVDPLVLADGFAPSGRMAGQFNSINTKQGGAVSASLWDVWTDAGHNFGTGWESCNDTAPDWCYEIVSDDSKSLTTGIRALSKWNPGWGANWSRLEIFAPGLSALAGGGDTTSGLRVSTESALGFSLGVNSGWRLNNKPILVKLDLGKRYGGCNVELTAPLFPSANGVISYAIPLSAFAVTNACGQGGVSAANERDLYNLTSPAVDQGAFNTAWAGFAAARASAADLIKGSDVVRIRFWALEVNHSNLDLNTLPVIKAKAEDLAIGTPVYATEITVSGAITIQ